jgi:hypothetical protein
LQVLYKPGMAHAGILVNTAWQATVIETFLQVIQRPGGSKAAAAAVAAAETPCGSAEDVAAAAAAEQQQQQDGCSDSRSTEACVSHVDAAAALAAKQQCEEAGDNSSSGCAKQEQQHKRSSSAASSADADAYSVDTDDTAWESMHAAEGFGSCGSAVKSSQCCSSCNCLNCQLFPLAVPGRTASSNDLEGPPDRVCSDAAAAAAAAAAPGARGVHWADKGPVRLTQQQQQQVTGVERSMQQLQGSYLDGMSDV